MTLARGGWRYAMMVVVALIAVSGGAQGQQNRHVQLNEVDPARLNETYQVDVRALNFRPAPTLKQDPISVVQRGDLLLKIGETFNTEGRNDWIKVIRGDGKEGWVSAKYVKPVSEALALVESAATFLAGLDPQASATVTAFEDVRAGFIYPAPVGDAGWSLAHDIGRRALEDLPFVSKTAFIDSVPEDPELITAAIEELVAGGSNLIFGASYGYMDPMMEAAKRHPDVVFMHASGFKTEPNAGTYFGRIYQARYLSGIIAGKMTQSNVIGFVAAFPIPEVIRGINAFMLGAQSVNPAVRMQVIWTKTWYGPGVERESAEALMDQGADVIAIHQDSPAAIQAAAQRGKYAIGFHSDMSAFGPDATLTSAIWDWGVIYKQVASDLKDGRWHPEQIWWGLDKGVVGLAPISDKVPAEVKDLVEQRRRQIADGTLRIFQGPIRDTNGDIKVPSSKILSDADLLTMDFYVLGVQGGVAPAVTTTASPSDDQTG